MHRTLGALWGPTIEASEPLAWDMTSQEMLRVLSIIDNMDFDITMHSYSTLKQNKTSETSSKI